MALGVVAWLTTGPAAWSAPQPALVQFELGYTEVDTVGCQMVGFGPLAEVTLGWSFTPRTPIAVTSLGFWDAERDGLVEPHLLGVWDEQENLLASALIAAGAAEPIRGDYRYADIEPVVLTPGITYVIGGTIPIFAGPPYQTCSEGTMFNWEWSFDEYPYHDVFGDSVVAAGAIALLDTGRRNLLERTEYYVHGPGPLRFPDEVIGAGYPLPGDSQTIAAGHYFAPNFEFTVVPEPATALLLSAGWVLSRRRRRQAGS